MLTPRKTLGCMRCEAGRLLCSYIQVQDKKNSPLELVGRDVCPEDIHWWSCDDVCRKGVPESDCCWHKWKLFLGGVSSEGLKSCRMVVSQPGVLSGGSLLESLNIPLSLEFLTNVICVKLSKNMAVSNIMIKPNKRIISLKISFLFQNTIQLTLLGNGHASVLTCSTQDF